MVLVRRKTDNAKSIVKKKKKKKKESWVPKERTEGGADLQATRDLSSHQSKHTHSPASLFFKGNISAWVAPAFFKSNGYITLPETLFLSELLVMLHPWKLFQTGTPFLVLLKSLEISIAVALENYAVLYGSLKLVSWHHRVAFLQVRGQVSMKASAQLKVKQAELHASGLSLGLQLCSWIALLEQQSFQGTSLICKSLNRWPATPSKPVSVVHRLSFCTIATDRWSCYSLLRKKCTNRRHTWSDFQVQDIVGSIFSWGILQFWISDMKRRNNRCSSPTNVVIVRSVSSR